ncbi:MAG: FHA domain-containing protein [Myxococcota bacterium]
MFAIVIHEKGGAERRETFDGTEISVGRVQGNDLMLPKGNVSKRHARLLYRDGRFIVTDLNSTNGTYVNRRRITQATIVREGDRIYIGDFVLRIEPAGAPAADASVAVPVPSAQPLPRPPMSTQGDSQPGAARSTLEDEEEELTRSPIRAPTRSSPAAAEGSAVSRPPLNDEDPAQRAAVLEAASALIERVARSLSAGELEGEVTPELAARIDQLLREYWAALSSERAVAAHVSAERAMAVARAELVDVGPLSELLEDPSVTEIAVIGRERLTVTRAGRPALADLGFSNALSVRWAVARLCARSAVPVGPSSLIERRLWDGTSLTATLSGGAPVVLLTRSRRLSGTLEELVRRGMVSRAIANFLQQCLLARLNLLVIGPRDGGVELLLGALAASLPESELIYAGHFVPERPPAGGALDLSGVELPEAVGLAARAPLVRVFCDLSGPGLTQSVVGAISDGADGLVVSRAASSLRRGLLRVISELRPRYADGAAEMLAGAFEIVIEVARLRDDRHRVLRVAEVLGADDGELDLADVFSFTIDRTASGGLIEGSFVPASTMPAVADLMRTRGAAIDGSQFTRPASR